MRIVFYSPGGDSQSWLESFAIHLPDAEVWKWTPECAGRQADYAVLWAAPLQFFKSQHQLKAIFNFGAGADCIAMLPNAFRLTKGAVIVKLNDAGMAAQMAEYVCHALFRHARDFAAYESQQRCREWHALPEIDRSAWPAGVMGLGAIGERVARSIAMFEFPTFGWARTPKSIPGITTVAGPAGLDEFLARVRVLVCVLPLTAATEGILNARTLGKLKAPGYLINVARGAHLVEPDLIGLLESGKLAGATLDVFNEEPLPAGHPFWNHPKITITPHIAAITMIGQSAAQIISKINILEAGGLVDGVVQLDRGY